MKRLIKRLFFSYGFELNRVGKVTLGWNMDVLKKKGIYPNTIFDVGVSKGTPGLYRNFPNSYFVLIEPLAENEPHIEKILSKYNGEYMQTAVGKQIKEVDINVDSRLPARSSIKNRTELTCTGHEIDSRKIPVTTLDSIIESKYFNGPYGLKIDTEGFEYEVICGAKKFLKKTAFVIAEVSVEKRFKDSYTLCEFMNLMDKNDFRLYDIIHIGRRKLSNSPLEYSNIYLMDLVFIKKDRDSIQ